MRIATIVAAIAVISTAPAIAGAVNEYQKLIASDGAEEELFGAAVAVDGDTSVIGAPASFSSAGAGAVYTFKRNPDRTWAKDQKLTAADGAEGDGFGAAVALDGDTLIVGAPMANDASGAAYVFERMAGDWVERQKLATAADFAMFGQSIALEFDMAMIGAPGQDEQTGAVYVFRRDGNGTWNAVQGIPGPTPGGPSQAGRFGASVALSRYLALIGNPAEQGTGAAYLFQRDTAGTWAEPQRLADDSGEQDDGFGNAVAIDRYRAVVGALRADDNAGSAYVFEPTAGGAWEMKQALVVADPTASENFGVSVALNRDTAVVGANGSAHSFTRDPDTRIWTERDDLHASEGSVAFFGRSVGWDGITAFIGASGDDQNGPGSGSSFVFRLSPVVSAVFPPTIHPRGRGIVPITVLGSEELDVSRIDPTTLRFGPGETPPAHDLGDSFTLNSHLQDVNLDGRTDLLLHFRGRRAGIACGDETAILTGFTLDGRVVEVSGSTRSIGCRPSIGRRGRVSLPDR